MDKTEELADLWKMLAWRDVQGSTSTLGTMPSWVWNQSTDMALVCLGIFCLGSPGFWLVALSALLSTMFWKNSARTSSILSFSFNNGIDLGGLVDLDLWGAVREKDWKRERKKRKGDLKNLFHWHCSFVFQNECSLFILDTHKHNYLT